MWINQPSTTLPYHKFHGIHVLMDTDNETAYPLVGPTISLHIPLIACSPGWPETSTPIPQPPQLHRELLNISQALDEIVNNLINLTNTIQDLITSIALKAQEP